MQNENLKKGAKTQIKSGEQAAEFGKKGGIKAKENRRKRKEIKRVFSLFCNLDALQFRVNIFVVNTC